MDESPSRMLFLRLSRGRASNATLLRNHDENAIPAPRSRSCILMTSASLKSVRNHCKTQKRAEKWVRNQHETRDSKKGLMRREPPMPSSQNHKIVPKPPRNAQSGRTSARAPAHTCSECHACHTRRRCCKIAQRPPRNAQKGTKTPGASRRAHQIVTTSVVGVNLEAYGTVCSRVRKMGP